MQTQEILHNFIQTKILAGKTSGEIGHDDDLLLSGLVNSLDVLRLVTFVQETFAIQVPPEDIVIENFQTIEALARYVQSRAA